MSAKCVPLHLDFFIAYNATWNLISEAKFGLSWGKLQDAIDCLRNLKKFCLKDKSYNHLRFFEHQLVNLEKLYPYEIFFSIGAIAENVRCSICDKDINSLECPHIKGELYNGKLAVGIIENVKELNHVAIVKNPANKRCVVEYKDTDEQFDHIRYLANLLNSRQTKATDFYELKITEKTIPNPNYKKLGRNDKCYCGSGVKFKNCCINKEKINSGHIDIISKFRTVDQVMT